jgi:hypothetical protein
MRVAALWIRRKQSRDDPLEIDRDRRSTIGERPGAIIGTHTIIVRQRGASEQAVKDETQRV